ncbi:hypothetical protein ER308_15195 [Egibacter rhizosphaerae]|uniref:Nucleotidyl transferase AbiEii/AbiGii toxin family protein n=1 Tax=Egibacter rhizosphaerae TaxID=1670831 RepID=A0A411YHT2_9ACTN|nr:hypothetical protein [Egibacter rhizosphaerae]QBI20777.1 hypothetical protein ER308_15195 [Egibacter rhizosphaerae]
MERSEAPRDPRLVRVLGKGAELQEVVPGAVLVGGGAVASHAGHSVSVDHEHVVEDLEERFDAVLEHLEALGDFSLVRARPGKLILGRLGDIETGVRQLIRSRRLEALRVDLDEGHRLVVPTREETLRIKAWLVVSRNQVRDYLDVAALADLLGVERAATVLAGIDVYYADVNERPEAVATQVARQLADPRPRDRSVLDELDRYKGLAGRWREWSEVTRVLGDVAEAMLAIEGDA